MNRDTPCPEPDVLRRFMLGEIAGPDAESLDQHLESCGACNERVTCLPAEDDLVASMRERSPILNEADDPLVRRLVDRARGLRPVDSTARGELDPTVAGAGEAGYDILADDGVPVWSGRVGPFQVARVLGRGGMGVVFEAVDGRLGRTVALKVLLDARYSDPNYRARFRAEAAALACLQHPNIVQIHEVGEQRGRPYLTLEYVAGGSLGEYLRGRPQPSRAAADLVRTLARAAQYAHEKGVVHRDLKPGNVLLSFRGKTPASAAEISQLNEFTPKIADFGLALRMDEPGLTQMGDVLGTPGYAAPELTRGDGTTGDAAATTDVYSLGAILYEVLIGRPPFRGATVFDTLEQARKLDPVAPRRLRPDVPRDLETICLKCLQKEPARRYPSAAALADDLDRFLAGEPIKARPAGRVERLAKWARRRPALAALLAVSGAALLALAVGGVLYERRLQRQVAETIAERQRADANYREARDAIRRMLAHTRAQQDLPQVREHRRRLQEDALTFYLKAAEQQGGSPEVRADVAQAYTEAGQLQYELGRVTEAKENLERAIERWRALAAEFPQDRAYRAALVRCLPYLANCRGDQELALKDMRESVALSETLAESDPASVEYRALLATCHHTLADGLRAAGQHDEVEAHYLASERLRAALAEEQPGTREHLWALATTRVNLSNFYQIKQRWKEMERYHDQAAEGLEGLLRDNPRDHGTLQALAVLRVNWSYVLGERGQSDIAVAELTKSVAPLEAVLKQEPGDESARDRLARTYGRRAEFLEGSNRHAEAAADRERCVDLSKPGDERQFRRLFLAMTYARAGRHAEAVREADALGDPLPKVVARDVQLKHLAQVCAVALTGADADDKLPPAERVKLVDAYAAKARDYLTRLRQEVGPEKWPMTRFGLLLEKDFAPLRKRSDMTPVFAP